MPIMMQNSKTKLMCGGSNITKMYCRGDVIYSSGNSVTYYVDMDTVYQEEVEEGESCLEPKSFTPEREDYTFAGWSPESGGEVLDSMIMEDEPITLYAAWTASTLNATGNRNYVTTSGMTSNYWRCGVWYKIGEDSANGAININYNGYKKVSIVFTFEYNGTNGEVGTVTIGGATIVNCKKGIQPASYTYSGSAASIAISMHVRNDNITYSWSDIIVRISSVTLSM